MKITTYVDEKLLDGAMKAARARTKREVIEEGLRRVIKDRKHREFAQRLDAFNVTWTHDELMRSRE
jgi:Arc/MetJ family transcription regulator